MIETTEDLLKLLKRGKVKKSRLMKIQHQNEEYYNSPCFIIKKKNIIFLLRYEKNIFEEIDFKECYITKNKSVLKTKELTEKDQIKNTMEFCLFNATADEDIFKTLNKKNRFYNFIRYLKNSKRVNTTKNLLKKLHMELVENSVIPLKNNTAITISITLFKTTYVDLFKNFFENFFNQNQKNNKVLFSEHFIKTFKKINSFQNHFLPIYFNRTETNWKNLMGMQKLPEISHHEFIEFKKENINNTTESLILLQNHESNQNTTIPIITL